MDAVDFRDLVAGCDEQHLADFLKVSLKTFRRWKTGAARAPAAACLALKLKLDGEVAQIYGKAWEGFRFGQDGQFYVPGWRGGFDPHAIRAMFFRVQQVASLEAEIRRLRSRIEELEGDLARETDRAERYRWLVRQESRWGMIWARVVA